MSIVAIFIGERVVEAPQGQTLEARQGLSLGGICQLYCSGRRKRIKGKSKVY